MGAQQVGAGLTRGTSYTTCGVGWLPVHLKVAFSVAARMQVDAAICPFIEAGQTMKALILSHGGQTVA